MRKWLIVATVCLLLVVLLAGLALGFWWSSVGARSRAAKVDVIAKVKPLREFCEMFPGCKLVIVGMTKWTSERPVLASCLLYDRYEVSLKQPVRFGGFLRSDVIGPTDEDLLVSIIEIREVHGMSQIYGEQWRFGPDVWTRLVLSRSFVETGIVLEETEPVDGIEVAVEFSPRSEFRGHAEERDDGE